MFITVLKVFYKNRNQKSFNTGAIRTLIISYFKRELNSELLKIDLNNADLSEFTEIILSILDKMLQKNKSL